MHKYGHSALLGASNPWAAREAAARLSSESGAYRVERADGTSIVHLANTPYRINGNTGHLFVDDCGMLDEAEFRPSCLGRVDLNPFAKAMTYPTFWEKVERIASAIGMAIIKSLIPVAGSKLLEVFGDAMGRVFDTINEMMGESSYLFANLNLSNVSLPDIEIPSVDLSSVISALNFHDVIGEITNVFQPMANTIAGSINSLVTMLKDMDPTRQYVYAYVGLRESVLQLIEAKIKHRPAALVSLVQQAMGTCTSIRSLKDALDCDRVRGNIVLLATALPLFGSASRPLDERAMNDVVARMPDFKSFVRPEEITNELSKGFAHPGLQEAQSFVENYTGDRAKLLERWKEIDITQLVPEAMKPSAAIAKARMALIQTALEGPKADAIALWKQVELSITGMWRNEYQTNPIMGEEDYLNLRVAEEIATNPPKLSPADTSLTAYAKNPDVQRENAARIKNAYFNPDRLERWRPLYDEEYHSRGVMRGETNRIIQEAVASIDAALRRRFVKAVSASRAGAPTDGRLTLAVAAKTQTSNTARQITYTADGKVVATSPAVADTTPILVRSSASTSPGVPPASSSPSMPRSSIIAAEKRNDWMKFGLFAAGVMGGGYFLMKGRKK